MERKNWPWRKKLQERETQVNIHAGEGVTELGVDAGWAIAPAEVVSKEKILAKQHAKVAEEAVSGWETAEADAAALRQELEIAVKEKVEAASALQECRKQMEWDKEEIEKLSNEKELLLTSLQDAIQSNRRAELELRSLETKLEAANKDKCRFKYELHLVNKEVQIRSEEREFSKKAAEISHRKHLDNVRKIAQLEAECQRLRGLVRRKADDPRNTNNLLHNNNMSSSGRWKPTRTATVRSMKGLSPPPPADRDHDQLEVQSLRSFSRSQYSCMSLRLDNASSVASELHDNDDEISCAESWASALLAELDHFKKDKGKQQHEQDFTVLSHIVDLIHPHALHLKLDTEKLVQAKEKVTGVQVQGTALLHFIEELFSLLTCIFSGDQQEYDSLSNVSGCVNAASIKSLNLKKTNSLSIKDKDAEAELEAVRQQAVDLASSERQLQLRLQDSQLEIDKLRGKIGDLNKELQSEQMQHQDLSALNLELQKQLQTCRRGNSTDSLWKEEEKEAQGEAKEEVAKSDVKLAECQRTIENLGKQLKTLAAYQEGCIWEEEEVQAETATPSMDDPHKKLKSVPNKMGGATATSSTTSPVSLPTKSKSRAPFFRRLLCSSGK